MLGQPLHNGVPAAKIVGNVLRRAQATLDIKTVQPGPMLLAGRWVDPAHPRVEAGLVLPRPDRHLDVQVRPMVDDAAVGAFQTVENPIVGQEGESLIPLPPDDLDRSGSLAHDRQPRTDSAG